MLKHVCRGGSGSMNRFAHLAVIGVVVLGWTSPGWADPMVAEVSRFDGNSSGSTVPPDTMGAHGPQTYVELLNAGYSQYNAPSGFLIDARLTLDQFWDNAFLNTSINTASGLPGPLHTSDSPFDPRIVYDANTQRWYAISVDHARSEQSEIYVGVTTGDDPSPKNWRGFVIDADADDKHWADFPTLGYSSDALFIGASMKALGPALNNELHLTGVPLLSLTSPIPRITGFRKLEDTGVGGSAFPGVGGGAAFQPGIDTGGVTSAPGDKYFGFQTDSDGKLYSIELSDFFSGDGSPGIPSFLGVAGSPAKSVPYQDGQGLTPIETAPALAPVQITSNVVLTDFGYWGVMNVIGTQAGSKFNHAIQWFNVDAQTGQLINTGVIEDPDLHFFYPSIAVNKYGKVAIGFNWMLDKNELFSGGFIPGPSTGAVGGVIGPNGQVIFGDPNFDVGANSSNTYDVTLGSGRNRWGDYSATTAAPLSPIFHTIQEYVSEQDVWSTTISSLIVISDVEVLINPDDTGGSGGYGSVTAQAYDGGFSLQKILMEGNFGAMNLPEDLMAIGEMATESYMLDFSAVLRNGDQIQIFDDLELLVDQKFTLITLEDGLMVFDTQLLSFELFGLPPDLFLTLDDARPSFGRLALVDTPFGTMVESYIDLFTVLGIDGESLPSLNASHLILRGIAPVPEPVTATLGLMGLGMLGMATRRRAA